MRLEIKNLLIFRENIAARSMNFLYVGYVPQLGARFIGVNPVIIMDFIKT